MCKKGCVPDEIRQSFAESGITLFCYDEADSTNRRAREYAGGTEGSAVTPSLFVAQRQTCGRGRQGRSFYSPDSTGLYMTLLLEAPSAGHSFTRLTSLSAVAAAEAIDKVLGLQVAIKWVNDLYLDGKKVAGILAESFPAGDKRYVALGIGINIFTKEFPEELRARAGSLRADDTEDDEERKAVTYALALVICQRLISALACRDQSGYMEKYRAASCVIGKRIAFELGGVMKQGRAVDITDMGELCIELDTGESVKLSTGEISVFSLDGTWEHK